MRFNSIGFYLILNSEKSPGVHKKFSGLFKAGQTIFDESNITLLPHKKISPVKLALKIAGAKEDVLFVRSLGRSNFYLIFSFLIARLRKKKIVIEVPTPNKTGIREIYNSGGRYWRKIRDIILLILIGPIPYWFANKIVIYADDHNWFTVGCNSKVLKIGNGVDLEKIPSRTMMPPWPAETIELVGVASVNFWHGYDRVIRAIKRFNTSHVGYDINFNIIGDGPKLKDLKSLVNELNIKKNVHFAGFVIGDELQNYYSNAHFGVGSLALFRKGLQEASEIKAREYSAAGIPFIATGTDPDFPNNTSFRIMVKNEEEIESLIKVFKSIDEIYQSIDHSEIREYAEKRLSYDKKLKKILENL